MFLFGQDLGARGVVRGDEGAGGGGGVGPEAIPKSPCQGPAPFVLLFIFFFFRSLYFGFSGLGLE